MRVVGAILWLGWGYYGCGWLVVVRQGRRGLPARVLAALISMLILFFSALLLETGGWPITVVTWGLASGMVTALLATCPRPYAPPAPVSEPLRIRSGSEAFAWLAIGIACAVIFYRAVGQPLTGADTGLRWDFLARQIVAHRTLAFYPAVSASDFTRYMWPEGIPPLLSLLYAWSYLGWGTVQAAATFGVVIGGALLVFTMTALLAEKSGVKSAGLWAVALLATSAVHTWSVSMGQETGLVTLGVLAMLWGLGAEPGASSDWLYAAVGAGVTGLSRDYALVAAVAGSFLLSCSWRTWARFSAACLALIAPWYIRTWWRTGNPLYNQDLFGLFPVNAMQANLMRLYRSELGFQGHWWERFSQLKTLSWVIGLVLGGAGLLAVVSRGAWRRPTVVLVLLWTGLWAWSVAYTAGGFAYALRVFSPVLALTATAGGVLLARTASGRGGVMIGVVVLILAAEASVRAVLQLSPPHQFPPTTWLAVADSTAAVRGNRSFDYLATVLGPARVMVSNPYDFAYLAGRGVAVAAPWSPEFGFLNDRTLPSADAGARLRACGVSFLLLSSAEDSRQFFGQFPLFRGEGAGLRQVAATPQWRLLSLDPEARQSVAR